MGEEGSSQPALPCPGVWEAVFITGCCVVCTQGHIAEELAVHQRWVACLEEEVGCVHVCVGEG